MNNNYLVDYSDSYFGVYTNFICSKECSIKSLAAKASVVVFPIFILLATIFSLMDKYAARDIPLDTIKVNLNNALQYNVPDSEGEYPPACTFHAFQAMIMISSNFDGIAEMILDGKSEELSAFQRSVIQAGLEVYGIAIKKDESLKEGADLQHVREPFKESIRIENSGTDAIFQPGSENNDLNQIVNYLFEEGGNSKVAWLKNGNSESVALIAKGNRVIFFDSHKNEIVLLFNKEQVMNEVQSKLGNEGVNLFDYAVGRGNR